ncbi:DUF3251 domain-containing protein [Shigella flexneri]
MQPPLPAFSATVEYGKFRHHGQLSGMTVHNQLVNAPANILPPAT